MQNKKLGRERREAWIAKRKTATFCERARLGFSRLRRGLFRLSDRQEKGNKVRGSWEEGKRKRPGDINFPFSALFPRFLTISPLKEPQCGGESLGLVIRLISREKADCKQPTKACFVCSNNMAAIPLLNEIECKPSTGEIVSAREGEGSTRKGGKAQFRRRASAVPNLIAIRFDCSTAEARL